jgi:hypothetical protein
VRLRSVRLDRFASTRSATLGLICLGTRGALGDLLLGLDANIEPARPDPHGGSIGRSGPRTKPGSRAPGGVVGCESGDRAADIEPHLSGLMSFAEAEALNRRMMEVEMKSKFLVGVATVAVAAGVIPWTVGRASAHRWHRVWAPHYAHSRKVKGGQDAWNSPPSLANS